MLKNIIGFFWVLIGVIFFISPNFLKNRVNKKTTKTFSRIVIFSIIGFGLTLIASVFKLPGLFPKIAAIVGIFILVKGALLIFSKTKISLSERIQNVPNIAHKIAALIMAAFGVWLIMVK